VGEFPPPSHDVLGISGGLGPPAQQGIFRSLEVSFFEGQLHVNMSCSSGFQPKKWRCDEGLNARHDMLKTKSKEKSGDNLKKNWNLSAHRVSASLVKFTRFRYHRY
jgi:hypothetical protein